MNKVGNFWAFTGIIGVSAKMLVRACFETPTRSGVALAGGGRSERVASNTEFNGCRIRDPGLMETFG